MPDQSTTSSRLPAPRRRASRTLSRTQSAAPRGRSGRSAGSKWWGRRPSQLSRAGYHPGDPRWAAAARSDAREAPRSLTSAACLARSADRAGLWLSPADTFPLGECGNPAPDCRPRRALLHLSYSSAPLHADGAFVTHDPKRTLGGAGSNAGPCPGAAVQVMDRTIGDRQCPGFEVQRPRVARQDDIRGLVEECTHPACHRCGRPHLIDRRHGIRLEENHRGD
jgi:hypothetical protein